MPARPIRSVAGAAACAHHHAAARPPTTCTQAPTAARPTKETQ